MAVALGGRRLTRVRTGLVVAGALLAGILSHLLLDLLPHYAWVVHLDWFKPLPFHWLLREAALGLLIAAAALAIGRRSWPYVALGMLGGIYPDVEKVLSVDFDVPGWLILFEWHSASLSSRTAGLPKPILIALEFVLIATFLLFMWRASARVRSAR